MSDQLISREALAKSMRKSINERYKNWGKSITVADIATLIFDEIDNAPTVEPLERIGSICEENCGYRQQGKWIDVPCERDLLFNKGIKYTCSACGKFNSYGHSSFCPNCGADMRGAV